MRRYHSNWREIKKFAVENRMMFVPSIGPGYIDDAIRPWNLANARDRDAGRYYARSWKSALAVDASIISITSFNEWHEGMQ